MKALKSKWVGKLASRLWGGARRLWIRPAKHRWWPPAVLALVLGIVFVFLTDPTKAIWSWPGASAAGINGLDKPAIAGSLNLIRRDNAFVAILSVSMVLMAVWLNCQRRREHPDDAPADAGWKAKAWHWLKRWGLFTGTCVATIGYAVSDLYENKLLRGLLDEQAKGAVTDSQARHLAQATNCKWGLLIAAVLGTVALAQRRLPVSSPLRHDEYDPTPDRRPVASGWSPSDRRLGIAVTGGGVRAASFANGVFQELRDREVLAKARYVTSVSGGGYMAGALTAVNQDLTTDPPPFAPHSPEEQAVRRRLRYFASDWSVLLGAVARIIFGVFLNLFLLYVLLFALLRPVGWLIGSPLLHPELRLDDPVAVEIERTDHDPDRKKDEPQPWEEQCGLDLAPEETTAEPRGVVYTISDEPHVRAIEIDVVVPAQCVLRTTPGGEEREPVIVGVTTDQPGVLLLERGELKVERQPTVKFAEPDVRPGWTAPALSADEAEKILTFVQPKLKVATDKGVIDLAEAAQQVEVAASADLDLKSTVELVDHLDVDTWNWLVPLALLGAATLLLAMRVIGRPNWWRGLNTAAAWIGIVGLGLLALFLVLPWLIDRLPTAVLQGASTAPSDERWAGVDWLPIPRTAIPNLVAWPLLSLASIFNFTKGRAPSTAKRKSKGSTRALIGKAFRLVRLAAVGLLLIAVALGTAIAILTAGVLNGPSGEFGVVWVTSLDTIKVGPLGTDMCKWFLVTLALLASRGTGEAAAWSLAPIYKRRLAHAFMWRRSGTQAIARDYAKDKDGDQAWEKLLPTDDGSPASGDSRRGFVDGEFGDGSELVLCCAANVLGEDRAPTGRSAVSFTISRSWIGGPEVGWVSTHDYLRRMGRRRAWDFTLPGAVATSGAAAAPAMGKKAIGPIGSILAMLNVRLGAWVPHPKWVERMPGDKQWNHNPGWPWFVREVVRRYRWEAPYLYLSDGGHWENLGLVEALRRGCTRIVAISAGGDGPNSHAAIAAAIEIARTDLDVEIELDQMWMMRPEVGSEAGPLPSGRQLVHDGVEPELGRVSPQGYAFGKITFRQNATRPAEVTGHLLVIDATLVDRLPPDVHDYAESHPEFPHVSTGDQLFTDRDFEAYRVLGRTLAKQALDSPDGATFLWQISGCARTS